jgi:hypothetical protein
MQFLVLNTAAKEGHLHYLRKSVTYISAGRDLISKYLRGEPKAFVFASNFPNSNFQVWMLLLLLEDNPMDG